jgi:hypothetical protein
MLEINWLESVYPLIWKSSLQISTSQNTCGMEFVFWHCFVLFILIFYWFCLSWFIQPSPGLCFVYHDSYNHPPDCVLSIMIHTTIPRIVFCLSWFMIHTTIPRIVFCLSWFIQPCPGLCFVYHDSYNHPPDCVLSIMIHTTIPRIVFWYCSSTL